MAGGQGGRLDRYIRYSRAYAAGLDFGLAQRRYTLHPTNRQLILCVSEIVLLAGDVRDVNGNFQVPRRFALVAFVMFAVNDFWHL